MNKISLYVFTFFLSAGIIISHPIIPVFTSAVPFQPGISGGTDNALFRAHNSDIWLHTWNLWWVKYSLLELKSNPYFTGHFFFPDGVYLYLHGFNLAGGILSIPFQSLFGRAGPGAGLAGAYNTLFLLSFVLSGFFMFKLAYLLIDNVPAAVIAGIIFTLAPYHFEHLHHLEHLSLQWLPAFLYCFLRLIREHRITHLLFALIFYVLVFYTDLYVVICLVLLCPILLFFCAVRTRRMYALVSVFALLALLVSLPLVLPIMSETMTHDYMKSPDSIYIANSADLLAFLLPPFFHPLFGGLVKPIYDGFTGLEKVAYLGITVLILSWFGLKSIDDKKLRHCLLGCLVFFSLLALGPWLHISGTVLPVPMPYLLLKKIPLLSAGRAPVRFVLIDYLILSVLAGFGVRFLLRHAAKPKLLLALITTALVIDFLPPVYSTAVFTSDPFYQTLKTEPGDFAVCELPITEWPEPIQYYQTIHQRPILAGMITYFNPESYRFIVNTPLALELYNPGLITPNKTVDYYFRGLELFRQNRIKYILFHPNYFQAESREKISRLLQETLKLTPVYTSNEMTAYRLY